MKNLAQLICFVSVSFLLVGLVAAQGTDQFPALPEYGEGTVADVQKIDVTIDGQKVTLSYTITAESDAVFDGDIVLGRAVDIEAKKSQGLAQLSAEDLELYGLFRKGSYLWPKGIVQYKIDPSLSSPSRVNGAIKHWEKYTDIKFEAVTGSSGNFILFVDAPATVCSSSIGKSGGAQKVRLGSGCSLGNAIHEIGHALGLGHEQMRSDRDQYVVYHPENVKDGYQSNFEPKPWFYANVGDYCYGSIMHYGELAFSSNGGRTLDPKQNVSIGQRDHLADCDIKTIQKMYAPEYAKR